MKTKVKFTGGAFATLAACVGGPAFAQSSLTLYGNLDTSLAWYNTGNENTIRMNSGSTWGSRFGLKGSEDIGDGYRIIFKLEQGFSSNSGAAADPTAAFSRESYIGLSGDFGTLQIGKMQTPTYVPSGGYYDAFLVNTMASGFNNFELESVRQNNAVMYWSPTIHGFSTQLMLGLRDATMTPTSGVNNYHAAVEYNEGPWALATSYESIENSMNTSALHAYFGGGSYGFDKWRVFLGYHHATETDGTVNNNDYAISLRYQLDAQTTLAGGYAWVHSVGSTAPGTADQFSVEVRTYLSKTTEIYASLSDLRNRGRTAFTLNGATVAGVPAAGPGIGVRGAEIGVLHFF